MGVLSLMCQLAGKRKKERRELFIFLLMFCSLSPRRSLGQYLRPQIKKDVLYLRIFYIFIGFI